MALENFIPEVWSSRLLVNLRKSLVFGQPGVIGRDYEGEIQNVGDTVRINSIGAVTVGDYAKNTDIGAPQTLTDAQRVLSITKQKYFNFQVDDVDAIQQQPKVMNEAMAEAAYALANVADQYIAGLYVDADASTTLKTQGSPGTPDAVNDLAYEYLVDLSVVLDEANVPETGRWAIVPPWYEGLLLKDNRFVSSGVDSAAQTLANGVIGRAAGFTIMKSNNAPNVTSVWKIMAGHPMAWSFAEQVRKVEAFRPEQRFADAVKGLHLYGAKVVRPTALAVLHASRPA